MTQPYHGPEEGPGIAADGGVGPDGVNAAKEFAEMIVDTVREGLLVLDLDLRVQAANESFYRMFGAPREHTEGRLVYELMGGQWDLPELRDLLERILPERHVFDDFEVEHEFEGVGRRVLLLNARQLNHHHMVLLAVEDVTERVQAREEVVRANRALEEVNRELGRQVEARTRQVRKLAAKLSVAEQEERRRIAHVLHDDLQQQLFGASMMLSTLGGIKAEEARGLALDQVKEVLGQARDLTRTLSVELSPGVLKTDRLAEVLRWLASQQEETYGLAVTVEGDADVGDPALRTLLYHLVREALFNVVKHAETRQARIMLSRAEDGVMVLVEDEGAGFDVSALGLDDARAGFGLASIQERLELMGGRFRVDSAPGEGTRVTLTLPVGDSPRA